jgi:hypothetical protein
VTRPGPSRTVLVERTRPDFAGMGSYHACFRERLDAGDARVVTLVAIARRLGASLALAGPGPRVLGMSTTLVVSPVSASEARELAAAVTPHLDGFIDILT